MYCTTFLPDGDKPFVDGVKATDGREEDGFWHPLHNRGRQRKERCAQVHKAQHKRTREVRVNFCLTLLYFLREIVPAKCPRTGIIMEFNYLSTGSTPVVFEPASIPYTLHLKYGSTNSVLALWLGINSVGLLHCSLHYVCPTTVLRYNGPIHTCCCPWCWGWSCSIPSSERTPPAIQCSWRWTAKKKERKKKLM